MNRVYIVDAGVLFTKWVDQNPEAEFVTTQEVMDEIINRPSQQRVDFLISAGRLRIESYDPQFLRSVREASSSTGDLRELSTEDRSLLALALTRRHNELSAVIASTDLALLNTAISLDIEVVDPSGRLRHRIVWRYTCPSCKHTETVPPRDLCCPVCGTRMRRTAVRKERLH